MAEGSPPYMDEHPPLKVYKVHLLFFNLKFIIFISSPLLFIKFKAITLIAQVGIPDLKNPERWSDAFKDFLSLCTEMDSNKRKSAAEMLEVKSYYIVLTNICKQIVTSIINIK